jgi:hypothetical protein
MLEQSSGFPNFFIAWVAAAAALEILPAAGS